MGKRRAASEEVAREQELEALLFGRDAPDVPHEDDRPVEIQEGVDFVLDVGRNDRSASESAHAAKVVLGVPTGDAAWEDEDDRAVTVSIASVDRLKKLRTHEGEDRITGMEYSGRLRKQFEKFHPNTAWAKSTQEDEEANELDDGITEMLRSSGSLLKRGYMPLPPGVLSISRLKDANVQEPCQGVVQCIQFHPSTPLLLTAAFDKTLRLFQVDGVQNPKVQSVHLADLPISRASFSADGKRILAAGRRRYIYSVDIESGSVSRLGNFRGLNSSRLDVLDVSSDGGSVAIGGEDGSLVLLDQKSLRQRTTLKVPTGAIRALAFPKDSNNLHVLAGNKSISVWDVRSGKCISTQDDEGAVQSSALSVCTDFVATGSSSGVVNIYKPLGQDAKSKKTPALKALMNLTTPIDQLRFNSTGEVLAFTSRQSQDAIRLVHTSSQRVFSNWPTKQTPLSYVSTVAFSPNSGLMGVGNDTGRVLLFRLNAYKQY